MKKQKHTDENQDVTENFEQTKATQASATDTAEQEAENIENEIELMAQKFAEMNDKNLRLMAEFDNYRKRTMKERMDLLKTAGEKILVDMLPLVDDFERGKKAMETSEDVIALKEGIDLIYSKFIAFLLQNGVKAIETDSQPFDTEFHEAVTTFPAPTEEMKGKIIDCVSRGYTLNDKVIRFAKVVVGE
jgi:molecular chaperone GrpE